MRGAFLLSDSQNRASERQSYPSPQQSRFEAGSPAATHIYQRRKILHVAARATTPTKYLASSRHQRKQQGVPIRHKKRTEPNSSQQVADARGGIAPHIVHCPVV